MWDLWAGKYVLLYPDGTPVALDMASGGYPFRAYHPSQVKFWNTLESARKYADMDKQDNFTVHRVERLEVLQERFTY